MYNDHNLDLKIMSVVYRWLLFKKNFKTVSLDIGLPYVTVKIIRVNLPFPLKEMFTPEEELVTLYPNVVLNVTFDGDESHSQVYNFTNRFYGNCFKKARPFYK